MNQTLQAERDLRARIKARLEHGCLWENCQEHGPVDAHDVMLVSCISEHAKRQAENTSLARYSTYSQGCARQ